MVMFDRMTSLHLLLHRRLYFVQPVAFRKFTKMLALMDFALCSLSIDLLKYKLISKLQ